MEKMVKMKNLKACYAKVKNAVSRNSTLIALVIFAVLIFCTFSKDMVERTGIFATVVIAAAALHLQNNASKKDEVGNKEKKILDSCKLIRDNFVLKYSLNSPNEIKLDFVDQNGLKIPTEKNGNVYIEVSFSYIKLTKECTLYVLIKSLKGDNFRDYIKPYRCIHFISTNVTNAIEIIDVADVQDNTGQVTEIQDIKSLSIENIKNDEWNEIMSVLSRVLTSYAMRGT